MIALIFSWPVSSTTFSPPADDRRAPPGQRQALGGKSILARQFSSHAEAVLDQCIDDVLADWRTKDAGAHTGPAPTAPACVSARWRCAD
jgi:hypothetical protein